jgi:natural product biosynthesis luciferase-like monooxygenase protein
MQFGLAFFSGEGDAAKPLDLFIEAAVWADRNNLAAVWIPERHFHPFGGAFSDPAVAGAAVAAITSSIEVRSGSIVSPLHDIVEIVERWSMVDQISNGRVGLTFAPGWRKQDFILRPEAFPDRRAIMQRQIEEARILWAGGSVCRGGLSGAQNQIRIFPQPVQQQLPVWLACSSREAMATAGTLRAGVFTHLVNQSLETLQANIAAYRTNLPPGTTGRVAVMLHTYIGTNDTQAREVARGPLSRYLQAWADLSNLTSNNLDDDQLQKMLAIGSERYLRGKAMIGSLEACLDFVEKVRAAGADEIACLIDFGIDRQSVFESLERLRALVGALPVRACQMGE